MTYSTIEADLEYTIETQTGRGIDIVDLPSRTLPQFAPQPTAVGDKDVLFKLNLTNTRYVMDLSVWPEQLTLFLYQPKSSVTDLTSIYDPPSYQGHGPKGNYLLLSAPNDPPPRKEDTPLWTEYVAPNWNLSAGAPFHVTQDQLAVVNAEAANTTWPGSRNMYMWTLATGYALPRTLPLRVASSGVNSQGELFLLVLEIRRHDRCRLMARTIWVKPPTPQGSSCPFGSVLYGTPFAPQVGTVRRWRDETLRKSALGRAFIRAYYRCSPTAARLIERHRGLKVLARAALIPTVRLIDRQYSREST